LLGKQAFYH